MRRTARLNGKLERNLISYAAASAAGFCAVAVPQSAKARVIYTPTHVVIGRGSTFHLDLNNDGANDVMIYASSTCEDYCFSVMSVARDSHGNGGVAFKDFYALALRRGARIGPAKKFTEWPRQMVWRTSYREGSGGPWLNVKNRYLGLRFLIDGKTHYGWARLSVVVEDQTFHGTLTGYAYETIPDRPIIAGNRGISIAGARPKPTTLGHLALGAAGKK
jgi:hypothetical protein